MRTIIWFIYFWGYLLFSWPMLHKGLAAQKRVRSAWGGCGGGSSDSAPQAAGLR